MACALRSIATIVFMSCLALPGVAATVPVPVGFQCNSADQPKEDFLSRAQRFVFGLLSLSPIAATQAGYHGTEGHNLDAALDDFSNKSIRRSREFLLSARACFSKSLAFSPEDQADLSIIRTAIDAALFQLDELQPHRYRPDSYVELIGTGLFFPLTQTHGTDESRLSNAIARMEQVPRLLSQAMQQLQEADDIFISTAMGENEGNSAVIRAIGAKVAVDNILRPRYDAASTEALAAIARFSAWLQSDLAKRAHTRTWRLGPARYAKLFPLALGTGTHLSANEILRSAEQDLGALQVQMYELALPLHRLLFPSHGDHAELTPKTRQNRVIAEVLQTIDDDHSARESLLEVVQSQLDGIHQFIIDRDLLKLSTRNNLQVVATPEFLRGVYSVAGFNPAPPLDPRAQAQYWVTPIDKSTSAATAESKLREYNNWMLQYLSMHEALPGHYTQFEHANDIQPESRRLLRVLLANNPYTEGWGEYAVKEMADAGYANGDPRFLLMVLKIRLRVAANAILDIRLHTRGMSDAQALDLMQNEGFQTRAEAEGKLVRAKLTAGQLPSYYVGFRQWSLLRQQYEKALGPNFSLKEFNEAALNAGPLPLPVLEKLLLPPLHARRP